MNVDVICKFLKIKKGGVGGTKSREQGTGIREQGTGNREQKSPVV
jgi:hypothetical protein